MISIIILAAGNSKRFGSNKLLTVIDGKPMFHFILEIAEKIKDKDIEIVVVTQYEEIYEEAKKRNIKTVINEEAEKGISTSIKLGIKATENSDAWLFSVSDQPWMTYKSVINLISLFKNTGKGLACISNKGQYKNPCIFSNKYKEELLNLSGDIGGKSILKKNPQDLCILEVDDIKEVTDIDYPYKILDKKKSEKN